MHYKKRLSALALAGIMSFAIHSFADEKNDFVEEVNPSISVSNSIDLFQEHFNSSLDESLPPEVRDRERIYANEDIHKMISDFIQSSIKQKMKYSISDFDFSKKEFSNEPFYLVSFYYDDTLKKYLVPSTYENQQNVLYELFHYMDRAKKGNLNIYELYTIYHYLNRIDFNELLYDEYSNSFGLFLHPEKDKKTLVKSM